MGNFELIDNMFQVVFMFCAAIIAAYFALRHRSRQCLILGFAYACMSMGTLYYVLCLAITGVVPHVFYVSEISWLATWFFYLSIQILRTERMKQLFSWPAGICAFILAAEVLIDRAFGPSYFVSTLFALTAGMTLYLSVLHLQRGCSHRSIDAVMICCIVLQVLVYFVSDFTKEYTHFNLYFAMDILLTISMATLLPLSLREVRK